MNPQAKIMALQLRACNIEMFQPELEHLLKRAREENRQAIRRANAQERAAQLFGVLPEALHLASGLERSRVCILLDTVGDIYPEFAFMAHEALGNGGLTKSDVRARYMVARVARVAPRALTRLWTVLGVSRWHASVVLYAELVYIREMSGSVGYVFCAAASLGASLGGPGLLGAGEKSPSLWESDWGWTFATQVFRRVL